MSSNSPVPVPRTGVPFGIADPVVQARAELKATLAAIAARAGSSAACARAQSPAIQA